MDKVQSKLNKIKELLTENVELNQERKTAEQNIYELENEKSDGGLLDLFRPELLRSFKKFIANLEFKIAANTAEIAELEKECQDILN